MKNSFLPLLVSIFLCSLTSVIGQDNLLNFPLWETGTGNTTDYWKYGSISNNIRELGTVPHDQYNDIVWKAVPGTGGQDGGWHTNAIGIGNNDTYRFTSWIKKGANTSGTYLFGFYAYENPNPTTSNSSADRLDVTYHDGSTHTNPWNAYFVWDDNDKVPDDGNWYLVVSYVYGNSVTQFKTDAGVYDLNGTKVYSNIKQFKVPSNATHVRHRNYLIGTNNVQDVLTLWYPTVYSMNGSEPSISELLNPTSSSGDTMAPTVPTGLTTSNITATSADLNWSPSTDNGGGNVAGYYIYNNGVQIATSTGTSTQLTGLTESTSYQISVGAFDNATPPNVSAISSPSVDFTTLSSGGGTTGGDSVWAESSSNSDIHYNAGNVGIGTANPSELLDVNGNIIANRMIKIDGHGSVASLQIMDNSDTSTLDILLRGDGGNSYIKNGNVGIGTTTPDAKLAVNGTIHSKEVRVDLMNWPDYVFTEDYKLLTLEEIKKHISEKGHLPNIPSAQEIEENGVQLGEMNKLLLEKIEELTLYTLEQQELLKKLVQQNDRQEEEILFLKKNLK